MDKNLCRACMRIPKTTDQLLEFTNLLEDCEETIGNLWKTVNPELEIDENENHKICSDCLEQLNLSYNFRIQCIKTANDLKNLQEVAEIQENKGPEEDYESYLIIEETEPEPEPIVKTEDNEVDYIYEEVENLPAESTDQFEDMIEEIVEAEESQEIYCCSYCGSAHKTYKLLYQHEKRHKAAASGETSNFTCDICNKSIKDKFLLKQHILNHISPNYLNCNECTKTFNSRMALMSHQKNVHGSILNFRCTICCKEFKLKAALNKHLRIHNDSRPFACDICSKRFRLKHHLQQHYRMHSGEKIFKCTKCEMSFSHYGTLNAHVKAHITKEQGIVFPCPFCNRTYSRKKILDIHVKSHTEEKKFSCDWCSAKYHQKSDVKSHIFAKHLNDLTFQCEICSTSLKLNERFHKTYASHVSSCHKDLGEEGLSNMLDKIKKLKIQQLSDQLPEVFQEKVFRVNECSECYLNFSSAASLEYHKSSCH